MIEGESGQVVGGRFELVERLGSGGMGTVWRARDLALHREVALKQVRPLAPELTPQGSAASRMLREARALARISHPNVVTIHHVIDEGEGSFPWLVMELVPGRSLADRLGDGSRLYPVDAARIGREVLAALRTAHAAGICHRDVKPANVMLRPDGGAILTDFGIAAMQRPTSTGPASASLTATGELVGTPDYVAPERIRGTDDDPASDLWSLGMLLYVCVEGHNPLRRPTPLATLAAVLDGELPPPVRAGALAPVLAELLVRDPAARPAAERLDGMLAAVAEGHMTRHAEPTAELPEAALPTETALGPPPFDPPPAPGSRHTRPWLITVAAAVAAVLIGVTAYTLGNTKGDDGSDAQANKLHLIRPGTLTVAVAGTRSGSAHNLAYAANDSGWLEDTSPGPKAGDWIGPDPDLAKALGERLGLRVRTVGVEIFGPGNPFKGLGKEYDVLMPSSKVVTLHAKERQGTDFLYYLDYGYTAYAPWKTARKIHSWADLCGLRVAAFGSEEAIREASYRECGPKPIKQTSADLFDYPKLLRNGSLDAVVSDLPYAVGQAKESDGEFHLAEGDLTEGTPVGMAVQGSNAALSKALQRTLNELISSGTYRSILKEWDLEDGAIRATRVIRD
ncbi:serine/threonine-protein kinase [Streptomyces sp. NPDC102406]|uniref:serine/threonine-protein kinase n=1 Tax=Streptomyces sp. NPDC102406 TaxID=3366171 RepID=UPI0037F24557